MTALYQRDRPGGSGRGQVIDLAIIEPILTILGMQPQAYDQLGIVQGRTGNRSVNNAPRNTYRTAGRPVGRHLHLGAVRRRAGHGPGGASRGDRRAVVRSRQHAGRARRPARRVRRRLDRRAGPATRSSTAFEAADAAVAPIYDIGDVFADPQFRALDSITTVEDPVLGPVRMQNVLYRLSETPAIHPMDRAPARRRYAYGARGAPRTRRADPRRSRRRPDRVRNT